MSDGPKKRAHIKSSFNDTGTGECFTAGDTILIDAGAFANYEAAGLVTAAPATKAAKPKSKPNAKTKTKVAPQASTPPVEETPEPEAPVTGAET